ncbi:MAG TPA: hypothetical protein VJ784_14430, partial [Pyrinomonadaceae bacterium]|nr:hypothetical protein [Pyrinomonadaceae bacterium]
AMQDQDQQKPASLSDQHPSPRGSQANHISQSDFQPDVKSNQDFPRARELTVVPQNLINYTLDHAMGLSVILACKETHGWFYESYVQLYSLRVFRRPVSGLHPLVEESDRRADDIESIAVHFAVMSGRKWFHECLVKKFFGDDPDDIVSFIMRSINLGSYLRLELDEYYLPNKRSFGTREWVHPTLVYGYDDDRQVVLSLGFDTKVFTKLTFEYSDLRRAYASARRIAQAPSRNKALVSLIRMWEPLRPYPFSRKRFLGELQSYLYATIDSAKKFALTTFLPASVDLDSTLRWGCRVYEHVEIGLQQLLLGHVCITYVPMHALYEHKRFLAEAFKFVISEYKYTGRLVELADDFQRVVRAFHSIRWKFLRYEHSKDPQLIREILEQLNLAKADERRLLQQICDELQSTLPLSE